MVTSTIRRWSTDDVQTNDRLDYWIDGISQAVFGVTCVPSDPPHFRGSVSLAAFDALTVSVTSASKRINKRNAADVARDSGHHFYVLASFEAGWSVDWRGKRIELGRGDLFFGDTRYVQSATMPPSITAILLPPEWLSTWLSNPDRLAGHRVDRSDAWGAALSTFVERLSPDAVAHLQIPAKVFADNVGALLGLIEAERRDSVPSSSERALVERIMSTVRQRACEVGLAASDIARSLNISERTLHRSFAHCRHSFASVLLDTRLDLAKRMLASKNLRRVSTGEIGRRAGFADPSHFVRAMSRHVGVTPVRYRHAALGPRPTAADSPC